MPTLQQDDQHSDASPAPTPSKSKALPVVVGLVAVLIGGGIGAVFVGPRLSKRAAAQQVAVDTSTKGQAIHVMENLVLNPAGTGGTRFLMASVAIVARSTAVNDEMNRRDAELRDVVLRILGARTIDELANLSAREPIKREILDSTNAMFGPRAARTVYLPQFVIQ